MQILSAGYVYVGMEFSKAAWENQHSIPIKYKST